jgi:outer membrane protein OmpA-like peptidoglycan-associated protein
MEVKKHLSSQPTRIYLFLAVLVMIATITGCASSSVGRSAADSVDTAYQNSNSAINHAGDNNPEDAFQNSTQTTKGILLGATTGAVIGGVTSGGAGVLPVAVGGAAIGGVLGAYIDYHTNIVDRLENRGVKVLILGDQIMMVMSSAWTFQGRSATIRSQAYSTLDLIAQFIRQQPTMSVKIAAYTNDSENKQADCFISQQQADKIVRYLWPRANTRVLTGIGMGGSHLVERNNPAWDQGGNYRIEITFEKLPV